ncbi:MAG: hypothetical protein ACXVCN_03775 [Bdellovibrio sp.]
MASKTFLHSLKKGQILRATVEEVTSRKEILCNFQGELLLVSNLTGNTLQKGDHIQFQVKSVDPLEFQIFNPRNQKFERVV